MSTSLPQSGGTTASFTNAPQANGDSFAYIEDYLLANSQLYNQTTEILTLDVMANDLGGKAKSLFSIDDGYGNPITDLSQTDLLTNSKYSEWQTTANGNYMRIANGKIEYRLSDGLGGYRDVDSLNAGEVLTDSFTYAIKLGNGTLSWARVNITLTGNNDAATISGTSTGEVVEAGGDDNMLPGTPSASGSLTVTDVDSGQATFATPPPASLAGAYGTFSFNPATGQWTFTLDNSRAATQALAQGESATQTLTVASVDGTATRTVSVTITGTNDAPVVAATDVTGAVTELVTPTGDLTDTGTIAFSDVDLTDGHSVSAVTPSLGALGVLTASVTTDTTGSGTGGVVTWNYSVAASAVEYLAKDETKVETFTFTVDDGNGGSVERTVSVTITGTNDAPVVAATDVTGAVTELVTPTGDLTDTGTIAFSDVDLTDGHSVSAVTPSLGALGVLTASVTTDTTGSGTGGVVTWNYSVAASAVEYLAKDETKVETFTFTVDDGNGGSVERTVSVTITGTNDAPVVAATDVTGAVTELVTPTGDLTDTGTIAFSDVDLTDGHSVSAVTPSLGALGVLTASVTTDTTGSGTGGVVTWNYSVAASAVEYLAKDETKVETFTFTVDDGNGGSVERTVSVTITGTNDAPVVAATDVTGAVTELVTPTGDLTDTGTIAFSDVDLTDGHSVSAVTPSLGALGVLTASVTTDTTGSGTGGVVTWNYSVAASAVEYLAKDETKVETFTFTVDDGNGGSVERTVSVTITGTNDAPVVAATDVTGAVTELVTPTGDLTDTGTIAFSDVDLTDGHSVSAVTPSLGALGVLTASVTTDTTGSGTGGVVTWNYSVAASAVEYLAKDETKVETFTFTVDDGNGGSVERTVSVTITGTNDAPVVAATDVTGAVTELVTPTGDLTDTGTIAFSDVDLTDGHSVSAVTPSLGALGVLTASVTTDTTGSGTGGVVTWNYSVAASAVEYLAKDETKVETFTFTVDDGNGGSVERTVSVTITGTNDAPVVAATDVTGAVTELVTPTGDLTDTGTIAFSDVDLTDGHSVSAVTPSLGALGVLTASVTTDTTGSGTGGVVTWNYSVAASAVEYLAKDETKVETFTFTVDDGNGGSVERTVSVTITGTNDAPVVAATDVTGAVTELVTPTGDLTDTGTIAFSDVDLTDGHSVSAVTPSLGALGVLTASVTTDTTGSGTGGVVTWNYSVAASAVEYLAKDETKVETFTFTVDDGNGGSVERTVSVTITGTNDAPVVAATDVTGAVTELVTPTGDLTDTGTIAFSDVDLTDGHSVSAVTPSLGALGVLTASVTTDTTGSGTGGVVTWNYSVAASAVEYLAKDETKVETFTFTVDDGNGGSVERTVSVTITGTNDAPVVAATDVTGAVTELVTPTGDLTDTGTIAFSDVDLTDGHSVSAVTPSLGALGVLTASVTTDTTGSGTGGVVTWNYSVAASAVEYLAKDETKVETFTFTVDDGNGGSVERTVSVTITGTNDAPVVAATDVTGAVTELVTPTGDLTDTGTIAFSDVDLTDGHSVSAVTPSLGALGVLTASVTTDTTGSGTGGVVTWNYSVAASAVEYLAKDETKVETFTFTVDDGNGGSVERTVSVTITGTNDAPVVAATDVTGAVTELVTPTGDLTDTGTIAFSDVDLTDGHSVSAVTPSLGALGVLTASVTTDTTGSGTGGVVTWNYSVAASAVEYLAKDETKVETFTFTVDDGNGGSVERTVSVTITGTNDAPVVAATDVTGAVTELVTPTGDLTDTGTIAFSDVDLTDGHSVSAVTPSLGALGVLTASVTTDTTGSGTGGVVTWNYSVAASAVEYLAKDETKVETFTFTVDDGNGGSVERTVSVTITGTNDAPTITSLAQSGDVAEDGVQTASGQVTAEDVDNGAVLVFSGSETTANGSFAVDPDSGAWTYTLDNAAAQSLGSDEELTEIFTVTVTDEWGFTSFHDVEVTIAGSNDAPVLTVAPSGTVTEDGTVTATGAVSFTDADQTDTHTVTSAYNADASWTGGPLSAAQITAISSGFTADSNSWDYSVANAALQFLGAGESITLSFTVTVTDDSGVLASDSDAEVVTITINGTNDAAVISGTTSGSVTEAGGTNNSIPGTPTASGTLTDTDVDNAANSFTAVAAGTPSANGYGTFAMTAGGMWTYTLNNANAAVNALTTGQTLTDSFSVTTVDGTPQTVTVTIHGTTDNSPPIVTNDTIWVSNSTTVTLPPAALLGNDVDVDGISLALTNIVVNTGTLASPVTVNTDGSFTFTTGATGGTVGAPTVVTLTYTTSDGAGGTSTGTVTVNVVNTTSGSNTIDLTGVGAYQASYIDAKAGQDMILDGAAISTLLGGDNADTLTGNAGNDLLIGDNNNDTLSGGAGNDILRGGIGQGDTMDGGEGSEDLLDFSDGTAGVTLTLVQSATSTSIANGTGGLGNNDTYRNIEGVIGTNLNDNITGSSGNDILRGGGGNDTLNGAGGTDLIDFTDGTSGINFTLVQGAGATVNLAAVSLGTDTYSNFEGVIGTAYADTLTGSGSNDELRGGNGNDTIGGLGGNDRIIGGSGADTLTGGLGNDTFVFNSALNNVDTITDFNANATDKIELDDATFSTLIAGALSGANFAANSGGNAADGDDRVLFDTATGSLYYDADGSGAGAKVLFAQIDLGGLTGTIDATDFIIG